MISYETYIKSSEWRAKAKAAKERAGECALCTATASLEVHHRTYVRLGHEIPDDLVRNRRRRLLGGAARVLVDRGAVVEGRPHHRPIREALEAFVEPCRGRNV